MLIFETQNRRAEGKPDHKVTKLESQFYLFLDYLNWALNNLAQELHF